MPRPRHGRNGIAVAKYVELGEEQSCFIEGCPAQWAALPIPEGRIVVGLDGGYVRDWKDRKTNFEVIVGQSVPEERDARYVGLVHTYDEKPKRRLFDLLRSQGLQANQDVTFLTDGGEEVRALTELRACLQSFRIERYTCRFFHVREERHGIRDGFTRQRMADFRAAA
jgi:hypothetical protein